MNRELENAIDVLAAAKNPEAFHDACKMIADISGSANVKAVCDFSYQTYRQGYKDGLAEAKRHIKAGI